jgi:hypothetical protein
LFRVRGILGRNHLIPLNLASFGEPNRGYGMSMRYSYSPQSLVRIHGGNREIGIWIWRSWPAGCCSSRAPRSWPVWPVPPTSLTGANPMLGCARVNVLVSSLVSGFFVVSSSKCFGAREVGHLDLGFPSLDRSDWWATPAWPV